MAVQMGCHFLYMPNLSARNSFSSFIMSLYIVSQDSVYIMRYVYFAWCVRNRIYFPVAVMEKVLPVDWLRVPCHHDVKS